MVGQCGHVAGKLRDRQADLGGGLAMAAQVDPDHAELRGEIALRVEEGPVRHQAVQEHQRAAAAFVVIRDTRAVRRDEMLQV